MTTKAAITIHTMTTGVKSFPFLEFSGFSGFFTGWAWGWASKLALHISLVQQQKKCPCPFTELLVSRQVSLAEHESAAARKIKINIILRQGL